MSTVRITRCQAKDPTTCRYHGRSSIEAITRNYTTAKNIYDGLVQMYTLLNAANYPQAETYVPAILTSKSNLETASLDYYATNQGLVELEEMIDKEEDLNKKTILEVQRDASLQKLKDMEEGVEEKFEFTPQPSKSTLFILPSFNNTKLSPEIDLWEGNKYHPQHTVQRIREFVKQDIIHAKRLGLVEGDFTYKITSDHKTDTLNVELTTSTDAATSAKIGKNVEKLVKAYSKALIIRYPGGGDKVDPSFKLNLNINNLSPVSSTAQTNTATV